MMYAVAITNLFDNTTDITFLSASTQHVAAHIVGKGMFGSSAIPPSADIEEIKSMFFNADHILEIKEVP